MTNESGGQLVEQLKAISLWPAVIVVSLFALAIVIGAILRLINYWRKYKQESVVLEVTPPAFQDKAPGATTQLFSVLHGLLKTRSFTDSLLRYTPTFSLEIASTKSQGIRYLIRTSKDNEEVVRQAVSAYSTDAKVNIVDDPGLVGGMTSLQIFRQTEHFAMPLDTTKVIDEHDPVSYLTSSMTKLADDEQMIFQLVITPTIVSEAAGIDRKIRQGYWSGSSLEKRLSTRSIARIVFAIIKLPFVMAWGMIYGFLYNDLPEPMKSSRGANAVGPVPPAEQELLDKEARSDVKFMWNIHLSVAKKYSDNLREEAMKGWTEKLAQGWLPAPPPPGYMTVSISGKKIHQPDPTTKALIYRAFELYLEPNYSIQTICTELNNMGLRTSKGRPFSKSYTQKILTNPFYIGINRFNGKDYPGAQEPIITKELFDRVQLKMRRKLSCKYRTHNPVFKNIIRCSTCNNMVTWQLQKGRYYGACQRRTAACKQNTLLREDRLEVQVIGMLKGLVSPRSDVIEWLADAMQRKHQHEVDANQQLVNSIQMQINRVHHMDSNLYEDKLAGEISQSVYAQKHQAFTDQLRTLEDKLNKVDSTIGASLEQRLVLLELSQRAADIYSRKTPEKKRIIISKLFDEFTYKGGILSVNYTKFARAIAQNVLETQQLIGGKI